MTASPSPRGGPGRSRGFLLYLAALAAACLYVLLGTPVFAEDNDLWYHLSHGRHLFETGRIPDTSYFSFIEPARAWTDYYWAFQATVYSIFRAGGYPGLMVWRALLFGLFLWTLAAFLRRPGDPRGRAGDLWAAAFLGLFVVHSLHKFLTVRPHAVSYLLLALFLYVLEVRRDRILWLPVLAVLWTNFHGIEYPVMLLVAGAYLLDWVVDRWRGSQGEAASGSETTRESYRTLAALGLVIAAVFLTPHGARLIRVPFVSTEYASSYIGEHSQLGWREFFSYAVSPAGMSSLTAFNFLLLAALLGLAVAVTRRRLRWSHLAMLAGGLFLLTKAVRLAQECALLALPLIRLATSYLAEIRWPRGRVIAAALSILVLLPPWIFLANRWPAAERSYPLSLENLPHGIVSFLNHVAATRGDVPGPDASRAGSRVTLMNNPNVGGYLQWALEPGYRIFMDLEIPFLFADEDMYQVASAFFDREALRNFLNRYDPDFVAATLASTGFGRLIAEHPRYVPVFFDDQGVLYANRERHGETAERYRLETVDPYTLAGQRFSSLPPERRNAYLAELERISRIDGDVSSVNQALAILNNLEGRHDRALDHARRVVTRDPRLARGHALRGDALFGLDRLDEAVAAYRRALRRSDNDLEKRFLHKSLSLTWSRLGEIRRAYEAFRRGVGKFDVEADVGDLFRLGVLAAAAGEPEDARKAFSFALFKAPAGSDLRRQIEENLEVLAAR